MFSQLYRRITDHGKRFHHDLVRTRADLRHARDEYHLARAERPRFVARIGDLVARYNGVTLYRNRIQWGHEVRSLAGVHASVSESPARRTDSGPVGEVYRLTITGPDWEWTLHTVAVFSSRKVRAFAALINSYAEAGTGSALADAGS
ncbi:MAG TPA: hypothetical protein VH008_21515 [Pseudonocardia sp.]|nr:hypothetical protein [Pseudonocardia sp.]